MNKLYIVLLWLFFATDCFAQFSEANARGVAGVTLGIEKNNHVWFDYGFQSGFHINVEHTAIADKISGQSYRLSASYTFIPAYIQIEARPFISSNWLFDYCSYGCVLNASNTWLSDYFKVGLEYIPYYDSSLMFQQGWAVGGQCWINKEISIFAEYGRKPEFSLNYSYRRSSN